MINGDNWRADMEVNAEETSNVTRGDSNLAAGIDDGVGFSQPDLAKLTVD